MPVQLFEIYQSQEDRHRHSAALLSGWSIESGSMLPLTEERIAGFALSVLGVDPVDDTLLTHAAITSIERGIANIGGYVTNPIFRGLGLGRESLLKLITMAPARLEGIKTYRANVNEAGLSQFATLGELVISYRPTPSGTGCNLVVEFSPVTIDRQSWTPLNLLH